MILASLLLATLVEKTIADNARLTALDKELNATWRRARKLGADLQVQRDWLAERDACKARPTCIEAAYLRRLAQLRVEHEELFAAQKPPAHIFGRYTKVSEDCHFEETEEEEADIVCKGPETSEVVIKRGKGNAVIVNADVHGFANFMCNLADGRAEWVGGELRVIGDELCVLVIRFRDGTATLSDMYGACHDVYCGARAEFDGHVLKKTR